MDTYHILYTSTMSNSKINGGTLLSKHSDTSELYSVYWSKLCQHTIVNWSLNRPHDNTRLTEIMYQLKKQDYVDGLIYLTNIDGKLICYDGIHRIEALKILSDDPDYITDHKVMIHYYPIYNEYVIKEKFETLNKCVPVPEIYTAAHKELDIKNKIESIVKYFTEKYASMFKGSKRPNIPHENRDAFIDKVYSIVSELEIQGFSDTKIIHLFEQFNTLMSEKRRFLKLSAKQMAKCDSSNCYMFTRKDWQRVFIISYHNSHISLKRL